MHCIVLLLQGDMVGESQQYPKLRSPKFLQKTPPALTQFSLHYLAVFMPSPFL